jgi:hypothetical protein
MMFVSVNSNTTSTTSRSRTVYPSGTSEFTLFCLVFYEPLFFFLSFSFGRRIVCPSRFVVVSSVLLALSSYRLSFSLCRRIVCPSRLAVISSVLLALSSYRLSFSFGSRIVCPSRFVVVSSVLPLCVLSVWSSYRLSFLFLSFSFGRRIVCPSSIDCLWYRQELPSIRGTMIFKYCNQIESASFKQCTQYL